MKARLEALRDELGNNIRELILIIEHNGTVVDVAKGPEEFLEGYARSYGLDLPTEAANA